MSTTGHVRTTSAGADSAPRLKPTSLRPVAGIVSLAQLLVAGAFHVAVAYASPAKRPHLSQEDGPKNASDPSLWIYLGTAIALVLIGGAFAGLTIALMGQDEVYLQVIATSGEGSEQRNAKRVLRLLKRGKHWVLVTLLVGNVITNETLPIVLDRSIGGGYAAAIASTVLVIVFGEIVPQSICVRFGLPIGAWMAPIVLLLMWIFAPVAWPIAKLLDRILGEGHGTMYKKSGLKTLVTLHKTMGTAPGERLNQDEVSIISGVLDLKAKSVGSIMTPMNDVFTLAADAVLNEDLIDQIVHEGYSRIPVYEPTNKGDFVGMLLVKMLLTYDPEDCKRVTDFALATLPETRPETSCLDIINFFQEGKSHMVLVSNYPGDPYGALGVVTLEDVIEELIGEEIIDESDVFIDVHKAIRRIQPAPTHRHRVRVGKGQFVTDSEGPLSHSMPDESLIDLSSEARQSGEYDLKSPPPAKRTSTTSMDIPRSPARTATFLMRRASSAGSGVDLQRVQMRHHTPEMREHLRNLGPSNAARQPKQTRINTVKVKPGVGTIPENGAARQPTGDSRVATPVPTAAQGGIGQDLVSPGRSAKDGVKAVQAGHGSLDRTGHFRAHRRSESNEQEQGTQLGNQNKGVQVPGDTSGAGMKLPSPPAPLVVKRSESQDTLGSLEARNEQARSRSHSGLPKGATRSGSITENFVESRGIKKLVLEMTSSSEEAEDGKGEQASKSQGGSRATSQKRGVSRSGEKSDKQAKDDEDAASDTAIGKAFGKKRRRRRARKKKGGSGAAAGPSENNDAEGHGGGDDSDENTPLLKGGQ